MKMTSPAVLLSSILLVVSINCSTNIAGGPGTGSETTNGIVLSSTGNPVTNARVLVIDDKNWLERSVSGASSVVDSAVTNSQGRFEFLRPLPATFNVQMIGSDEGLLIKNAEAQLHAGSRTQIFNLKPYGTYKGNVTIQAGSAHAILIAGTTFLGNVDDSGRFELPVIPEGDYSVFASISASQTPQLVLISVVNVPSGTTVIQNNIEIFPNIVILEDFNDNDFKFTVLGAITGGSWYTFIDSRSDNGNSTIDFRVTTEEAYHGSSFKGAIVLRSGYAYPYAGVGFFLGNAKEYDLSAMEKITFWAKGRGNLRVNCETALIDNIFMKDHFGYVVTLDSSWKKYEVFPDSLTLPYGETGYQWKDVARRVRRIEFEMATPYNAVNDSLFFSLDNIYIDGMSVDSLLKTETPY